ncbi:MAG: CDP-diacylglycerol--glycerol-3-phosphate 3-phosphatidyltransferase [Flavipsychrobacter sp.]|nr:CDP-diacylglycerol--glycerol-3-phosphate 3-phosphatidyltransferase [Flavipsychrobacter sp.]
MLKKLPWYLIYLRLLLTIVAVLFGYYGVLGAAYVVLLAIAAATDYYDGVLARKYGVETAALRQWDSIADTIFFIGVLVGMWLAHPEVYSKYAWGIYAILGLEALRYIIDIAKFRRGASYHALSAKVFGVSLLAATIAVMGFGISEPFFSIAIVMGILSELEGLAMSLVLREWTYNIKHIGVAMQIRKGND